MAEFAIIWGSFPDIIHSELSPRTGLSDPTELEDDDLVGGSDGGETVGYGQDGHGAVETMDRWLNQTHVGVVESAGGFVEHEESRATQEDAGEGDTLTFAPRQTDGPITDQGVEARGEVTDEIGGGRLVEGRPKFRIRRFGIHPQ